MHRCSPAIGVSPPRRASRSSYSIPLRCCLIRPCATGDSRSSCCSKEVVKHRLERFAMEMPPAPTSNHGFNLLGKETFGLSHIPMFMMPHQFQVFLEVSIEGPPGSDPIKAYLDDQQKYGATEYVLISDPIVLPTLAPKAHNRISTFTGKLFRGWPFNNPNTAP